MANNDWMEIEIDYDTVPENYLEILNKRAEESDKTIEEIIIDILSRYLKKLEIKNGY